MKKNTSIALSEHFTVFVEEQVSRGRYGNASEVIRAGLRLLEEREANLEALRQAIGEGLQSGPAEPFDVDAFILSAGSETMCSKRSQKNPLSGESTMKSTRTLGSILRAGISFSFSPWTRESTSCASFTSEWASHRICEVAVAFTRIPIPLLAHNPPSS